MTRFESHGNARAVFLVSCLGLVALMIGAGCPPFIPVPPPQLLVDAGPDKIVLLDHSVTLDGSVSGGRSPYNVRWERASGPVQDLAASRALTAFVTGRAVGTTVYRLTVTDMDGRTASDTMTVEVTELDVTQPVVAVVCPVPPRRSDPEGIMGIQLTGLALLNGQPSDDLFVTWSLVSQPEDSGEVTIHSPHEETTVVDIGPPAIAGEYVFQFDAINEDTGEEAEPALLTLLVIDEPFAVVHADDPIRRNVLRAENNTVDVVLVYTFASSGTIQIYDGRGTAAANLLATVQVPVAGAGQSLTASIPIDGARLDPSDTYLLQYRATDPAGSTAVQDLVDPDAPESLQRLTLYVSDDVLDGEVSVVILTTEVGEVDGSDVIVYQGIGAGDPNLVNLARQTQVADINGDGLGDLLTLTPDGVEVRLGSEDIGTGGDVPDSGDSWKPADFTIAGANAGFYTGMAVGDFNDDGNLDVVLVAMAEATIEIFLLEGATENIIAADRTYSTPAAAVDIAPTVVVGDFNGDGVDDIAVGLPGAAHNLIGAADQGVVIVIYGVTGEATLPASGAFLTFDPTLTGVINGDRYGEVILGEDEFGAVLGAGQFIAGDGDELAVAQGAGTEVVVYQGGEGERLLVAAPAHIYTAAAAGDLQGGVIRFGDVTGEATEGAVDMIVTSPAENTVYFVPAADPDAALVTFVQLTPIVVGGIQVEIVEGDDLEVVQVGESVFVLVGATNRVLVLAGPVTEAVVEADVLLQFQAPGVGRNIAVGDVNADGLADWLFGSEVVLYMVAGLE